MINQLVKANFYMQMVMCMRVSGSRIRPKDLGSTNTKMGQNMRDLYQSSLELF